MRVAGAVLRAFLPSGLLVALAALATPAAGMTFALGAEGDCAAQTCIIARGPIEARSADDLKTFVQRNHVRRGSLVVLDSGGGLVVQGLQLGAYIRKQGFSTHVQGPDGACASACVYAYLGGVRRTVSDGARVGIHQISQGAGEPGPGSSECQSLLSQIAAHLLRMGAAIDILTIAVRVPPERLYWLSLPELARFHVITA